MRLFLAIPVPLDVAAVAAPLEGPQFRPVPPASAHMTVRFFGEADQEEVIRAMEDFHAPSLVGRFAEAGAFPDARHARVAWLGVESEGLMEMADEVRARVAGIGEPDRKAFVPHVTLGRFRQPTDARYLLDQVDVPEQEFVLERLDLMASQLSPQGPRYSLVQSWSLAD